VSPNLDLQRLSIAPVVRANSRPRQIAAHLREKFLSGSLRPGDRVPSERELAGTLHVSRAALREGLRILEAEGMLNVVHGRGTFVVDVRSRAAVTRATIGASTAITREILELTNVRSILEPEAAALAAQFIRRSEVTALRKLCERGAQLASREAPDFERLADLNRRFHLVILSASGNAAIERIVAGILDLLAENMHDWFASREQALTSWASDGYHPRIAEAVARGDAAAAQALMAEHIAHR
jgi:GntR family transcriptional repressor for pyruvate dehydrogenase complex